MTRIAAAAADVTWFKDAHVQTLGSAAAAMWNGIEEDENSGRVL